MIWVAPPRPDFRLNLNGDPLPPKLKAYAKANWQRPPVAMWNALPRGPVPL